MVARVERHPQEDDEVFVSDLQLLSGGAAANTASACGQLGLRVAFIGKLAKDEFGLKIINDFENSRVNLSLLKFSQKYGTGSAYVALNAEGDRRIYAHSGAANHLEEKDILKGDLQPSRCLFLSSLKNLKPFIKAAQIGRSIQIPVILNPGMLIIEQGFDKVKDLLSLTDILILSKREFLTLMELEGKSVEPSIMQEKMENLCQLGIKVLVITMGGNGALLFDTVKSELIPALSVEKVIDTTGAGDAFSAGFIYKFVQSLHWDFDSLKECVKVGNFIAGRCIQKLGARQGIPSPQEIQSFQGANL